MSWTETTRLQYRRDQLRYASDMTEAEWSLLAAFMPERSRLGRPRTVDLRGVLDAIFYILATGCQWRALRSLCPQGTGVSKDGDAHWLRFIAVLRDARPHPEGPTSSFETPSLRSGSSG
jgi:transposase